MAHRQINVSRGKLFITLLIFAVAMQATPDHYTQRLNIFFLSVFHPVLDVRLPGFSRMVRPAPSSEETVSRAEWNRLYATYENTRAQLIQLQQKYDKLSGIVGGLPGLRTPPVPARVITPAVNTFGHEIVIDEGDKAGIKAGQLVVSWTESGIAGSPVESFVIGSVAEVHETTATVRLLTDPKHSLVVSVSRQGKQDFALERQMVGNGKDGGRIKLVSREHDVRVGDTVYAASRAGVLDVPIVIGEVADVRPDEDGSPLLLDITVRPLFERKALSDVAVVVGTAKNTP